MATMIEIGTGPAAMPGVMAAPSGGRAPGIVVIQEWWGLVPHIESVVDRLADAGFVAVAPDLYRGEKTTEPDEAGKLMMGLRVAQAATDIANAADYLVRSGLLPDDRVGCMGFCMGGGLALLAPTVSPHIVCTSAFYPAMPWSDYHPAWANYRGREALVHQCEDDIPSTGPDIARYAAEIAANGGIAVIEDYPGTHHAFFNDDRAEVHEPASARLAWDRTLALFHRILDVPLPR